MLTYIEELKIHKVRHLSNISIETNGFKSILLTGKNGSGKTSVLNALAKYLENVCQDQYYFSRQVFLESAKKNLKNLKNRKAPANELAQAKDQVNYQETKIKEKDSGVTAQFNRDARELYSAFQDGEFILAYFKAERVFDAKKPDHIEKITLLPIYGIQDEPRRDFIKYLVDKRVSQSLLQTNEEYEKANSLGIWFASFENLLQEIFEDDSLKLVFDVDTFSFTIHEKNRETFDFNTMSAGYAAILDIAVSIIMRMEAQTNGIFQFDMPGIVLIDELETHLHYDLQKKILPFLCRFFPNIQFIVSTHSAFILNSVDNAVIYDLENNTLVPNGLSDVPYEGIIKGYFEVSTLSKELEDKFKRYKDLVQKKELKDEDYAEIKRLSMYLEEIPDYLALDLTTEYQRLKLEFENREED